MSWNLKHRLKISLLLVVAILAAPLQFGAISKMNSHATVTVHTDAVTANSHMHQQQASQTVDNDQCQTDCVNCVFCHAAIITVSSINTNTHALDYVFNYPTFKATALPVEIKPPRILT